MKEKCKVWGQKQDGTKRSQSRSQECLRGEKEEPRLARDTPARWLRRVPGAPVGERGRRILVPEGTPVQGC